MIEKQLKESKKYYNAQGSIDMKQFKHGLNQKLGEKRNKKNILYNFRLPIILAITLVVLIIPFSVIASFKFFGMEITITPSDKEINYYAISVRPLEDDFLEHMSRVPNSELISIEEALNEAMFPVRAPVIEGWTKEESVGRRVKDYPLQIIDIYRKDELKVVVFQYLDEEMTDAKQVGSYELHTYEPIVLLNTFGDNFAYFIDYQFDRRRLNLYKEEGDQIITYNIYSNGDLQLLESIGHIYLQAEAINR